MRAASGGRGHAIRQTNPMTIRVSQSKASRSKSLSFPDDQPSPNGKTASPFGPHATPKMTASSGAGTCKVSAQSPAVKEESTRNKPNKPRLTAMPWFIWSMEPSIALLVSASDIDMTVQRANMRETRVRNVRLFRGGNAAHRNARTRDIDMIMTKAGDDYTTEYSASVRLSIE